MTGNVSLQRQDEVSVVERARAGSREAFASLVRAYQARVYSTAWSVLRNSADAEDAAQEAFLRAYRAMGSLRSPFGPWLLRIAVNVALNAAKSRSRRQGRLRLVRPERAGGKDDALSEEIDRAMERLRPRQRLALELFHRDGLSFDQIAEVMGTSVAQVKNFTHRGRKELKKILGDRLRD